MSKEESTAVDTAVKQAAKNGYHEMVIRTGEAEKITERKACRIQGDITAVRRYLEVKASGLDLLACHLIVNRDKGLMRLECDEHSAGYDEVQAKLTSAPELEPFHINDYEHTWEPEELAKVIKMNRPLFESREKAMKLHSELKNFRAKVDAQVEQKNNDRGNVRHLRDQVVESNLPESFRLQAPIFKGEEPQLIEVEVNIHHQTLECVLVSPDLADHKRQIQDEAISRELKLIREMTYLETTVEKELAIIES